MKSGGGILACAIGSLYSPDEFVAPELLLLLLPRISCSAYHPIGTE
jgi:hypothetical protein